MIYYNEFDPKAAAWLWELIDMGMIGRGIVDDRSIIDVDYRDLYGFDQHHFFAGIGGWSYALRLAGWPDDRAVWTASLPCQPFSAAGKGLGKADERHLLPHFLELVKQCRPDVIFGEQVERAIAHGWLDDLQTTMEAENYAIGHCVLGAHSIGAAHIRQRLYWVADSLSYQREQQPNERPTRLLGTSIQSEECVSRLSDIRTTSDGRMGDAEHNGRITCEKPGSTIPASKARGQEGSDIPCEFAGTSRSGSAANLSGCEERQGIDWLYCRDGKYRPIESGIKPLVDGVPRGMVHSSDPSNTQEARVVRLKGYGNAIVPQVAAEFINAYCSI